MSSELVTSIGKGVVVNMASSFVASGASTIVGCATSCAQCPNFGSCQQNQAGGASQNPGGSDFFQQDFAYDSTSGSSGFGSSVASNLGMHMTDLEASGAAVSTFNTDTGAVRLDMDMLTDDFVRSNDVPFFKKAPTYEKVKHRSDKACCTAKGFTMAGTSRFDLLFAVFLDAPHGSKTTFEVTRPNGAIVHPRGAYTALRGRRAVDLADVVQGATLRLGDEIYYITEVSNPDVVKERRAKRRGASGLAALLG